MKNKPKIIVIVGPTASGKSSLAVLLAKKFNGEIISADSRQVYKGLDIGTGKVTKKEMAGIPHHLLNVANPAKQFNVEDFKKLGEIAIADIVKRGKIPIIVGGTGFYIEALIHNVILPEVKPDPKLREKLGELSVEQLFKMLRKIDPLRAKTIDPKNSHRLIRAIEIAKTLGKVPPIKKSKPFDTFFIGIQIDPEILKERINERLLARTKQGMVTEAKKLHAKGLSWKRMNGLGLEYRYLALHLQGKLSKQEMIEKLKTEIWHYAKRQMTWFKKDKEIVWFPLGNVERFSPKQTKEIEKEVRNFLTRD